MSDSEYEEEEIMVFADFSNQLLPHEIEDPNTSIKIIGIEDEHPMAEINGSIFKGTFDFAMGTHVFFDKDVDRLPADPLFEKPSKQFYKYFDKSNKIISFERIYVEEKIKDTPVENEVEENIDDDDGESFVNEDLAKELKIDITYEEAIQKFPAARAKTTNKLSKK